MNELTVVDKATEWRRMKSLVLDSVSSPITKRVYNTALDEFFRWYAQEPRLGFSKATVSAWRVTLEERGLGSSSIIIRMSAIRKLAVEATDNGLLAPELAAGIARVKKREVHRRSRRKLAFAEAGADAPERAGYHNAERLTRPLHHRGASGLRSKAVRSGGAYDGAHPAAGWPVVHRRFVREARARAHSTTGPVGGQALYTLLNCGKFDPPATTVESLEMSSLADLRELYTDCKSEGAKMIGRTGCITWLRSRGSFPVNSSNLVFDLNPNAARSC
jgi:hypothetical protein